LRRSPSLQGLQGDPSFESLLLLNQETAEDDQSGQFPVYMLRPQGKCQSGGPPCPLLIGLHTNGGMVSSSIDFWKPAASLGWLVAAPQSSQALMKGAYVWDDRDMAEQEIRKDFANLVENYSINPWQTVLAGHSLGGETAIWMTLKGSLENNLFLAVGPAGPYMDNPDLWEESIQENLRSGLRGYILYGELDNTISQESIATLVEMFNRAGIETEMEAVPAAEHDYQPEYKAAILRGLNYLSG
jgi:dienelactone hydrolase